MQHTPPNPCSNYNLTPESQTLKPEPESHKSTPEPPTSSPQRSGLNSVASKLQLLQASSSSISAPTSSEFGVCGTVFGGFRVLGVTFTAWGLDFRALSGFRAFGLGCWFLQGLRERREGFLVMFVYFERCWVCSRFLSSAQKPFQKLQTPLKP